MATSPLPTPAKKNIEAIAQIEQELLKRQPWPDRAGDGIAAFFGSFKFILAHIAVFGFWALINMGIFPPVVPFDPFPFALLDLLISIEFIFLTTFVLMNQNRESKRQEQWSHLTLQATLLAEREVTKSMQMLQHICKELKLEVPFSDEEANELAKETEVTMMVGEIEKARER